MVGTEALNKDVEGLAQAALRIVEEHEGRLVGLTLRIPADVAADRFRRLLDRRLADVGLDAVDLIVDPTRGPMRIVAADFHK